MHVHDAAHVLLRYESRQTMLERGLDLAGVLAQLRLDPVHPEVRVEVGLLTGGLYRVAVEEPVFAQFPAAVLRHLPHADVVVLGAGEIVERWGELALGHHADVGVNARRERRRSLGRTGADNVLDARQLRERLHDPRAVVAGYEDVDVADRLQAPADAAGKRGALDARHLLDLGEDALGDGQRLREEPARLVLSELLDAREDLLLRLLAHSRQLGDPAGTGRFLEVVDGLHAELVEEETHLLRPEVRYLQKRQQSLGEPIHDLVHVVHMAGGDQLADLEVEGLADAGQLGEPVIGHDGVYVLAEVCDGARGVVVGAGLVDVFAAQFEYEPDALEDVRDFGVGHPRPLIVRHLYRSDPVSV